MCNCGKSRQTMAKTEMTPTRTWREANHPHPLSAPKPAPARARGTTFEYVGATALTVYGPLTGVRYRFDQPGARIVVDVRDATALTAVPQLEAVFAKFVRQAFRAEQAPPARGAVEKCVDENAGSLLDCMPRRYAARIPLGVLC